MVDAHVEEIVSCLPLVNEQTTHYLRELLATLAPDVLAPEEGMRYGEQTKYVTWRVPASIPEPIHIMHITDVQFGHRACKVDRVLEYRDWILAEPNRFCVLGGDIVDAWAMHSPGSPFEQLGNPQSQVFQIVKLLAPMRHRIMGSVGGNHERRAIPAFGDLGHLLAALLRIPYSAGQQRIDIHYGEWKPFKISLWHGKGAPRTKGSVAQMLARYMNIGDSDLYLVGHVHQPMIIPFWKEHRVPGENRVRHSKCFGAVSSSFLETTNSYGEIAAFDPTDVLMANAQLRRSGKWLLSLS